MALERMRVQSVRCISVADVELHDRRNYFFGPNGAGKTSFLESIHLLGRGRSFRTRQLAKLVQQGADELAVSARVRVSRRAATAALRYAEGTLEARIDGSLVSSLAELARLVPVHVIDPQLHELIESGPSVRRRFIDAGVFHVEQGYLSTWRNYRRLLAQRNASLKAGAGAGELEAWSTALADVGDAVDAMRRRYVSELAAAVGAIGHRLLGQAIDVLYRGGWRSGQSLAAALADSTPRDRLAGFSQVGPHRADLEIRFAQRAARDAASRGQQKLISAALVLAQVALFAAATGHGGTVLVDDPAAELDGDSLERLLAELEDLEAQLVVTGLEARVLDPPSGYPVFHVEQGRIERVL